MAGLAETLLALGIVFGGHEMGHELEADRQNVPMSFDNKMIANIDTRDPKKLSRIVNAGFEGQDIITGALRGTQYSKPTSLASAINKIGYALVPDSIQGGTGDVRMIEKTKGKTARKAAQVSLFLSALSDMDRVRNPERNWDLGYWQSGQGTPGLSSERMSPRKSRSRAFSWRFASNWARVTAWPPSVM